MSRTLQGCVSVTRTHARGDPDLVAHLAGITAGDPGPAEPLPRRHRSSRPDLPHYPADLRQQAADFVERSPGLAFAVVRTHMSDGGDLPQRNPE
jgi:hypothetical protein